MESRKFIWNGLIVKQTSCMYIVCTISLDLLITGFGSHLVELLRDEYPLAYILSMAVSPFHTGETPLQHYNSLLCLSWLQKYVDGIMLFSNDSVLTSVQKMDAKSKATSTAAISFKKLNNFISSTIATSLMPVYDNRKHR